jgi:SHS2 domain-containing protein
VPVGRFRFLEDVAPADCALDIEGRDLDDLFETAGVALAEIMVDPETVVLDLERSIALEAEALDLLLHDWIAELIFWKDRDGQVFPRARIEVGGAGPFRLTGRLRGGRIDPERTARRADPKAVTFHQLAVERVTDGWQARLVIDI